MENSTEIITAKRLFDLVESFCSVDFVVRRGQAIRKVLNAIDDKSFRVSCEDNYYVISKTKCVDGSLYRFNTPSTNTDSIEKAYNDLM